MFDWNTSRSAPFNDDYDLLFFKGVSFDVNLQRWKIINLIAWLFKILQKIVFLQKNL